MNNKKIKISLIAFILLMIIPFASASVITGFSQMRYNSDLSVNGTTLSLMTANTTRIYINQNGLVGIGTLTPTDNLHLIGTARFTLNDTNNISTANVLALEHFIANPLNSTGGIGIGLLFRAVDNGSNVANVALVNATLVNALNGSISSALGFYTRNANGALAPRLFINGSNVGIGKVNPSTALDVSGTVTATAFMGDGSQLTGISSSGLTPWNSSGANVYLNNSNGLVGIGTITPLAKLHINDSSVQGALLVTNVSGNAVFFVNGSSGNVGIGTTSPAMLLHVYKNSTTGAGTPGIEVQNPATTGAAYSRFFTDTNGVQAQLITDGGSTGHYVSGTLGGFVGTASNHIFGINTNDVTRMVIDTSGNVGIGTTSPNYLLQTASGTDGRSVNLSNVLYVNGSSGNVGIGTTTPTQKLHVIGSVNVSDKIYSNVTYSLNAHPSYNPLDDGLVLYMPFSRGNESPDVTIYDRSMYGNDGVCNGFPSAIGCNWTTGPNGNALHFDGKTQVVNVSDDDSLDLTQDLTILAWVKVDGWIGTSNVGGILQKGTDGNQANDNYYFVFYGTSFRCGVGNGVSSLDSVAATARNLGQWYFVSCVLDKNNLITYVDAVVDTTKARSGFVPAGTSNELTIGNAPVSGDHFNGTIDEVRVYKRALSPDEIRAHYLAGLNATSKPYITSTGNVGIGTTGPLERLHIQPPSGTRTVLVLTTADYVSGTTGSRLLFLFGAASGNTYSELQAQSAGAGAWNNLVLQSGGGNVGIGTTSPLGKLHVAGDVDVDSRVVLHESASPTVDRVALSIVTSAMLAVGGSGFNEVHLSPQGVIKLVVTENGNVGIGNTQPNVTLGVSGNVNVSGRLSYGTLAANSPHFLETAGQPEPLCVKSSIGKYVGCMVNDNFEFECKVDDRCNRKYLDSRLSEEIEKLSKKITESKASVTNNQNAAANQINGNATPNSSNSITGNVINDVNLKTDLTQILEPASNTSTTTETTTPENSPNAAIANNNLTNETLNNATSAGDITATTSTIQQQTKEQSGNEIEDDKIIKEKIERLSKIKGDIKEKKITVKQAIGQLRLEELKHVDLDEIEDEETAEAEYKTQPKKSKEAPVTTQIVQLDYMTKVNGSVIIRLG